MAIGLNVVKRHFPVVIGVGGGDHVTLGILIVTGEFTVLNAQANEMLQGTGLNVSTSSSRRAGRRRRRRRRMRRLLGAGDARQRGAVAADLRAR